MAVRYVKRGLTTHRLLLTFSPPCQFVSSANLYPPTDSSLRLDNINLQSTYGPNAWLVRNYQLNSQLTELQATLTGLKEEVTEVNRSRRVFQEETGSHLSKLETRWQRLVGSTVQLEMACMAMEGEVRGLRRKEGELRAEVEQLEAAQ